MSQPPSNPFNPNGSGMPQGQANVGQWGNQQQPAQWAGQPAPQGWTGQGGPAPVQFQQPPKPKSWFARHKIMTGLLGLVVAGGVINALGGGSEDTSSSSTSAVPATSGVAAAEKKADKPAETQKQEAAQPAQKIGQVVHYNTFDFTVHSVKCGVSKVGGQYFSEKAQGQFCLVDLTVKNTGTKAQTLWADQQKLKDKSGAEYSYSSEATVAQIMAGDEGAEDVWLEEINPGNKVRGTMVYDIPEGAVPVVLHVSDGGLTDEGTDISLA